MTAKKTKKTKELKKVVEDPCDNPGMDCGSLVIEGSRYKTQLTKKFLNRKKWESHDPKKLYSHLPGTILEIGVSEGQSVLESDQVIILESMKMRNRIMAPYKGVIKNIFIKEGDRISKGELLFEME